jgi:hypothetical protein
MIPHIQIPNETTFPSNKKQNARHIYNELFIFYCILLQESRSDIIYQSVKRGLQMKLLVLKRLYYDKIPDAQQYLSVSFQELYDKINRVIQIMSQKPLMADRYVYEYNEKLLMWEWG